MIAAPPASETDLVYTLLGRFAWNVTAYQIVNPGIKHWFSRHYDAVIGYVSRRGVRAVAGAPVCDEADLDAVLAEWNRDCESVRERPCYVGAEGRLLDHLVGHKDYSVVALGAQPMWNPRDWDAIVVGKSSLRAQLARARNKGVTVVEWSAERAEAPADLHRVLGE